MPLQSQALTCAQSDRIDIIPRQVNLLSLSCLLLILHFRQGNSFEGEIPEWQTDRQFAAQPSYIYVHSLLNTQIVSTIFDKLLDVQYHRINDELTGSC